MTPTYLCSSSSSLAVDLNEEEQPPKLLSPNTQASSSSSFSYHIFLSPNQDQSSGYPQDQYKADNFGSNGGSCDHVDKNPVKWISSKMRMMRKMKNSDPTTMDIAASSSMETDNSSNSSSNICNNQPIRVCSDCNTTKTPLWRSGPKGPKSLCNACGIRQRKARRAMAVAAAAATSGATLMPQPPPTKTKVHHKEKILKINNGQSTAPYKKRFKTVIPPASDESKKPCFEEFLINMSKNLAFHRVFPQDEKEAAILLMALSCGFVHG